MSLADRLKGLRYTKGWGPEQLAQRAGISRTALYQIESGHSPNPRASTVRSLALALGVEPAELLQGEGPKPATSPRIGIDLAQAGPDVTVVSFSADGRRFELRSWPDGVTLGRSEPLTMPSPDPGVA
jgi:transcriptional regulator with XRE-family HTH domain